MSKSIANPTIHPNAGKTMAIPLMLVKCITTPNIPGYSSDVIDFMSEVIDDLVLYSFGVLVRTVKHGDFIIPLHNVKAMKPVDKINWDGNEQTGLTAAMLRQVCENRADKK